MTAQLFFSSCELHLEILLVRMFLDVSNSAFCSRPHRLSGQWDTGLSRKDSRTHLKGLECPGQKEVLSACAAQRGHLGRPWLDATIPAFCPPLLLKVSFRKWAVLTAPVPLTHSVSFPFVPTLSLCPPLSPFLVCLLAFNFCPCLHLWPCSSSHYLAQVPLWVVVGAILTHLQLGPGCKL